MSKKILVVDDEVPILELIGEALTHAGYQVITTDSAENALEILAKETIPVMFLDLNMPGMNGLDLCRRIRSISPMAQLFAFTGYVSLFELADCREAGFDDYFTKPVDLATLLKAAKDAFERIERWKRY